jgi:hypothetical protein
MYTPRTAPADPKQLGAFITQELLRISQELSNPLDIVYLREMAKEPVRLLDGLVVYADGTNWNPGQGEGLYERNNGAWGRVGTGVAVQSLSAAHTFTRANANGLFLHPSADTTARTWTIPANASVAYPVGTYLSMVNQNSAGVITIAITTDTMRLAVSGATGSRTLGANGVATAVKITSTEWFIDGSNLT